MSGPPSVLAPGPVVLDGLPLRVDPDEVLRFQGYKKGVDVPTADVRAIFDEALALGEHLMCPRVVYRASAVTGQGPDLIDAGGQSLHIPEIKRLWGPLTAVGAAICTVGDAIEERVRALFDERELPLAVMLDSVGSAAATMTAVSMTIQTCQVWMSTQAAKTASATRPMVLQGSGVIAAPWRRRAPVGTRSRASSSGGTG